MKVKLDENLGRTVLEVFLGAGHDAVSISQQALTGAPDARVFDVCLSERRILVTLDHDFGNLIRFPIEKSPGTMILEPTRMYPIPCCWIWPARPVTSSQSAKW